MYQEVDGAGGSNEFPPPRVLIVDDDVTLLLLMGEALEAVGFVVAQATDGAAGVKTFREFNPDLVLLDIQMPGMDGFSACEEIRRYSPRRDLPIVMVTSLDDAASIHRAFECGATDFLPKPINWPLFRHRVSAILAAASASVELAATNERVHELERIAPDVALLVARNGSILSQLSGAVTGNGWVHKDTTTVDDLWPEDIANVMRQRIKQVLKTRGNSAYEFEIEANDRRRYYEARFLVDGRDRVLLLVQEATAHTSGTEVYRLAYYDSQTQLPNRHLFAKDASTRLVEAGLRENRLAVLCVEFDLLNEIGRMLPSKSRDDVLRVVAQRLSREIRQSEAHRNGSRDPAHDDLIIARIATNRFAILQPAIRSRQDAIALADDIRAAFDAETGSDQFAAHLQPVIGVAQFPDDGNDVEELLAAAEAAMQEARAADNLGVCFYSESDHVSRDRVDVTAELRWAIERGQLKLHYQPRIDLGTGQVVAVEALLRWHHPLRGFVPLAELIPLAEATGLIRPIGEWVLENACKEIHEWSARSQAAIRISVNLSHQEFFHPDFALRLETILGRTGLEPSLLELELTERTLMRAEDPVASLQALSGLGVGFLLDDYGTGFSSLAVLKGFPVNALKIDRSFVSGLPASQADAAVCEVIITTAHKLGMKAIAEGVETKSQADFLRSHDCDEIQGFLVAPPLPLVELDLEQPRSAEDWGPGEQLA